MSLGAVWSKEVVWFLGDREAVNKAELKRVTCVWSLTMTLFKERCGSECFSAISLGHGIILDISELSTSKSNL